MIDPVAPNFEFTPVAPGRPEARYERADPMAEPQVSIVTPCLDPGNVLQETVQSVRQQSFQQWEWVIVNDGSSDPATLQLLDRLRSDDPRVRVVDHPETRGLSAARNTGFTAARTPLVVQLDADDLLEPTAVEKWYWFLQSHHDAAFCKGHSVAFGADRLLWRNGFHSGRAFLAANQVDATAMVRREVHAAVGGYDESNRGGLEDWAFWLRCADLGYWGDTIPEFLNWYRRRPDHGARWPNWDGGVRQAEFVAHLRERHARLWTEGFPTPTWTWHLEDDDIDGRIPCGNLLERDSPHVVLLAASSRSRDGSLIADDVLPSLLARGWHVSVVVADAVDGSTLATLASRTPDVFALRHFLRAADYPRFLHYLVTSRGTTAMLVAEDAFSHLAASFLAPACPDVRFDTLSRWDALRTTDRTAGGTHPSASLATGATNLAVRTAVDAARAREREERAGEIERRFRDVALLAGSLQKEVEELRSWIAELERGKAWLEQERNAWQQNAAHRAESVRTLEMSVRELERAKAWLEDQWQAAVREVEGLARDGAGKQAWIDELELRLRDLDRQMAEWREAAAASEHARRVLEEAAWVRFGHRVGFIKPSGDTPGPRA